MKHFAKSAFSIVLLTYFLQGCLNKQSSKNDNTKPVREEQVVRFDFDKIKERGYLIALMENSSTGLFVYRGRTMGYEYELIQRFCKENGLELRIELVNNLEEAFQKLNNGEGDVLAYNLTVTKERKERIAFTHYLNLQKQVLIQRRPSNWRQMKLHEIEKELIRDPIELIGEEVVVRSESSYAKRLANLSDEIGGDILITPGGKDVETEELIKMVAQGKVKYTVAEEDIALVNATYYPILDVKTAVSFSTQIAWGVRKNAPILRDDLNQWILSMR
ncbi:MAG: transporter substrate-binding domain-containing protein, partial [Bacteroidota bacterium]